MLNGMVKQLRLGVNRTRSRTGVPVGLHNACGGQCERNEDIRKAACCVGITGAGVRSCGVRRDDPGEYLPPAPPTSSFNAQSVGDPEKTIVVIYNHDSTPEAEKDVCRPRGATTPKVIKALAGSKARDKTIAVFAFCTPTLEGDFDDEYSEGEPKVVKRTKDIEFLMRDYLDAGLPPENLFLAGQGAAGWTALLVARRGNVPFAGLIAFAPSFGVPKADRNKGWRRVRRDHEQFPIRSPETKALVFGFSGDRFNPLAELRFVDKIPGATFVPLPSHRIGDVECKVEDPHQLAFDHCFRQTQFRTILNFIRKGARAG